MNGAEKVKIFVINGPNLNMLGIREPDHYGKETYADLVAKIEAAGNFNQGFMTTELAAAAILDLKWHMLSVIPSAAEESSQDRFAVQAFGAKRRPQGSPLRGDETTTGSIVYRL